MFNFLQTLFTSRHSESEITELKAANEALKSENASLNSQLEICQSEKEQLSVEIENMKERARRSRSPLQTQTQTKYDPFKH